MYKGKTKFSKTKTQPSEAFFKKGVLYIPRNSQGRTCARVSFLIKLRPTTSLKKTLAQVFSFVFCEVFKKFLTPLLQAYYSYH